LFDAGTKIGNLIKPFIMKTWNFGIIGTGNIADFMQKAVQSLGNCRLQGVYGRNVVKTEQLAKKYACAIYRSAQEMYEDPAIDVIAIATPSGAHVDPVRGSCPLRQTLICEKPLEISLDRIDRMIEAHVKSGTRLGGIFNYRFMSRFESSRRRSIRDVSASLPMPRFMCPGGAAMPITTAVGEERRPWMAGVH